MLARLQGVGPISFQVGCFTVHAKGMLGLGLTLVAIPHSTRDAVVLSIPFDQIKGDLTGGMAKFLAGGLWGVIKPQIESRVRKILATYGLPADTITVDQGTEGKTKVGKLVLSLQSLNAWLLRQAPVQGFKVTVAALWATEQGVNLVLDVYGGAQAAPVVRGLPTGPSYG